MTAAARRHRPASRLARPLLRLLRHHGRPWRAKRAELDARLLRLPASRFLRQRVRQALRRALAGA